MTAREVSLRIKAFLASGRPGHLLLNVAAPGQPGKRGVITVVEIHERLALTRGEPDQSIVDDIAPEA